MVRSLNVVIIIDLVAYDSSIRVKQSILSFLSYVCLGTVTMVSTEALQLAVLRYQAWICLQSALRDTTLTCRVSLGKNLSAMR